MYTIVLCQFLVFSPKAWWLKSIRILLNIPTRFWGSSFEFTTLFISTQFYCLFPHFFILYVLSYCLFCLDTMYFEGCCSFFIRCLIIVFILSTMFACSYNSTIFLRVFILILNIIQVFNPVYYTVKKKKFFLAFSN